MYPTSPAATDFTLMKNSSPKWEPLQTPRKKRSVSGNRPLSHMGQKPIQLNWFCRFLIFIIMMGECGKAFYWVRLRIYSLSGFWGLSAGFYCPAFYLPSPFILLISILWLNPGTDLHYILLWPVFLH